MTVALVLFGIAALGGLVMATQRLRGAPQPTLAIALVHGALAAVGLILLIVAVTSTAVPNLAKAALVLFLVAALGGFFLFAQHLQKKALPIPVMLVHAGVAVIGFICLLVAAVGTI
jgi:hypothetical protein